MGKNRGKSTSKHVIKRSNTKYYIKGQKHVGDQVAKLIAMAFYPIYYLGSKMTQFAKFMRSNLKSGSKVKAHKTVRTNYIEKNKLESLKASILQFTNFIFEATKKHKVVVSGSVVLLAVVVIGMMSLSKMGETNEVADQKEMPTHVVSLPPVEVATEVDVVSSTEEVSINSVGEVADQSVEIPAFKVLSFASVKAYQVLVDGKVIANFQSENEANRLLDELKAIYTQVEGSEIKSVSFSEEVKVELGQVDIMDFTAYDTVEATLDFIVKGTKEEKKHVVQKGENYWVIAQYYGISPYDLETANPDIKPESIQIGQEISLVVPTPIINVLTVEEASYTDQIAFEVLYEESSSLYKGESKTKTNGVYGQRAVVAEIIKENGREVGRKILDENITAQPQTKVVYKGTKDPPPKMGTGNLVHPTSRGVVTSEFGWRWGRRHTGIDIGLNVGSSVKAADGGVVTFAGYSSSYGRYIIIDHGGNVTTLYAHNSSLLVSKGDKVYQGQLIAYSGNTGYSTGPHLHFEVRLNGVPQNPRHYVNF